jgi:hypothetical protein
MSETRTITLTNRPPVKIDEDNWPVVASASDKEYDNQYESQANQISKWNITVRKHDDGRAIVYATYSYSSNWANSRDYSAKHGVLLAMDCTPAEIIDAINFVSDMVAACECDGADAARWTTLANECIADMPAEELS